MSKQDNSLQYLSHVVRNSGYLLSSELSTYYVTGSEKSRARVKDWINSMSSTLERVKEAINDDERLLKDRRNEI